MANTYVDYTATASQTDFAFSFPYLEDEHVTVEINGVATTDFTIVTSPSTKIVLDSGATAGQIVRVRRKSQPDTNLVDFVNGSVLTESELDRAYLHNRYLGEEIAELNDASLQQQQGGTDWDAKSKKIKNIVDPVDAQDAATKNYVDTNDALKVNKAGDTMTGSLAMGGNKVTGLGTPADIADATTKTYVDNKVNQVSTGATFPPVKWTFTGTSGANTTYTVTDAEIDGDTAYDVSIDGSVQEPTTDFTVDPDTDTLTIIPTLSGGEDIVVIQRGFGIALTSNVGESNILDNSVTTNKIAASAVTEAKIASSAVTEAKIADGSVTTNKIAASAVTEAKVADGSVTPAKTDFDQLTIEADSALEGQSGLAALEIIGVNGALLDLRQDPESDFDARLITDNQQTRLDSKDPILIRTGTAQNTALTINTDGKVQVGSFDTPAYALDVTGDVNVTGNFKVNGTNLSVSATPTGTVIAFAGSGAPNGYLLCDGTAVSRTTYATLFILIGTTYGAGDGSTTFNLPDLRGRVVAGLDNMGGTSANRLTNPTSTTNSIDGDGLGNTGGHETHTLLEAEMPSHTHSVPSSGSTLRGDSASEAATDNAGTSGATGGDGAHNNVQPTIILNYIIKT